MSKSKIENSLGFFARSFDKFSFYFEYLPAGTTIGVNEKNDFHAASLFKASMAHKIGDFVDDEGNEGYCDCGIVYVSRRPYLRCMFSIGNEQEAGERMSNISRVIYDYVSRID